MLNEKQTKKLNSYTEKVRHYLSIFIKEQIIADPSAVVFYNKSKYHPYTTPRLAIHNGDTQPIGLADYLARFPDKQQDQFRVFSQLYFLYSAKLKFKCIHQVSGNKLELFNSLDPIVAERFRKELATGKRVAKSDLEEFARTLMKEKKLEFSAETTIMPQFDESGNFIGGLSYYQYHIFYTAKFRINNQENLNILTQSPNNRFYFLPELIQEMIGLYYLNDPPNPTDKLPRELPWIPIIPLIQQNSKHLLYTAAHLYQTSKSQKIVMGYEEKQSVLALLDKIQEHQHRLFSPKKEDLVIETIFDNLMTDGLDKKAEKNKKSTLQLTVDKRALSKSLQSLFKLPKKAPERAPDEPEEKLELRLRK